MGTIEAEAEEEVEAGMGESRDLTGKTGLDDLKELNDPTGKIEMKGRIELIGPIEIKGLKKLNDLVREKVIERYDHKNLYLDVEDFRDLNPSAENIAIKIWHILRPHIDLKFDLEIKLYETERNSVLYTGPKK